jgi:ABC-type transport system substrate-binding protein
MRSNRKVWRIVAALLALAVVAAACGGDDDDEPAAEEEIDFDETGVLKVGVDLLQQGGLKFDPTKMGAGQYIHSVPVLRTLLVRNADGTLKPDLAESAEVVDPTTVSVTLRPGMKFSDGTALNAAAVKATFERNLASGNAAGLQIPDMQRVSSITIDSETDFTIKLSQPFAAVVYSLLAGVEFAPMSPATFTSGVDLSTQAVGAGPMKIVSYEPGVKVVFEKNDNYWDAESVKLAGMEYVNVAAGAATLNGLQSGQIDYATIEPDQAAQISGNLKSDIAPTTAPMTFQLCVKDGTPLGKKEVRQAFAYAIDRDAYNDAIQQGGSEPAWDLWPSASPWHNEDLDGIYERDVNKAKKLMADAGYANGATINVLVPQNQQRAMEVIQSQLKDVGITMGIVITPNTGTDFYQLVKEPMTFSQSRPGPLDKVSRFYLSNSFSNVCKYPVPKVDALYQELAGLSLDSDEATEVWHEIQQVIVEELAFFPMVTFNVTAYGVNTDRVGEVADYWDQLGNRRPNPVGTYIKA